MTTSINYPAELPVPVRSNYNLSHTSPFARTEMSTGRAKQRRTFSSVPTIVDAQFYLTNGQAAIFEAWFKYDILDGSAWFNAPLRTPLGVKKDYECRFVEMYDGPTLNSANDWVINAKIEIVERDLISQDWYTYGKSFLLSAGIIDISVNDKWPEP